MNDINHKMKVTLFIVFVSIFLITAILTLLSLFFDLGNLTPEQKDIFVKGSILEVTAGIGALFYFLFGLQRNKKNQQSANEYKETTNANSSNNNSIVDNLIKSDFIAPLKTAERSFLQILISKFSLIRTNSGVMFESHFDGDELSIWSRKGKRDLNSIILKTQQPNVDLYQNQLERYLIYGEGNQYIFDDPQFFFRYVSGGTLPVVMINNTEYYCLIYREIDPIGWNIASGGSDSREELLDPVKAMMRELNEELIIFDIEKKHKYFFGNSPDLPEFILVRELIKSLFHNLKWEELSIFNPEIAWRKGPDELRVSIGRGAQRITKDCFISINATDLGIEVDRIASFKVDETAIFLDGELCDGEAPGYHVVNAPIGLFSVSKVNESVKRESTKYEPDFFFWNGIKYRGGRIEEIIREKFIPSMAKDMSKEEKEYFYSKKEQIMDLCPVTKNIIKRSIYLASST